MIQLCVRALNPFLCRTHLSTEYQGSFLLISNTPHDMNRTWTWLDLIVKETLQFPDEVIADVPKVQALHSGGQRKSDIGELHGCGGGDDVRDW
jgi:hypothetical protein